METRIDYQTKGAVDASSLARLMLLWEEKRRRLDEIEEAIRDGVLQLRKTQTVGLVRATFNNPRKGYDYETPIIDRMDDPEVDYDERVRLKATVTFYSKTVVDWRAACKAAGIDPIVTPGAGPGSVSIKLLG